MPNIPLTDEEVIRSFSCYQGPMQEGYLIDFLGTRMRLAYLADIMPIPGRVEGYPLPASFHATMLEWAGSLRAVLEAKGTFVVAELGAGWAPWLVSLNAAAKQRGIRQTVLIGVEGSHKHWEYAHSHFRDNDIDPARHTLIHGVVGVKDGFAEFPLPANENADFGRSAVFQDDAKPSLMRRLKNGVKKALGRPVAAPPSPRMERVASYSVPTLLAKHPRVDLLHIDIQGHEVEVVTTSRDVLRTQVRRMVIGTHGRAIEEQLMTELFGQGWVLEGEEACQYAPVAGTMGLSRDGCQVWANPALAQARQAA